MLEKEKKIVKNERAAPQSELLPTLADALSDERKPEMPPPIAKQDAPEMKFSIEKVPRTPIKHKISPESKPSESDGVSPGQTKASNSSKVKEEG